MVDVFILCRARSQAEESWRCFLLVERPARTGVGYFTFAAAAAVDCRKP